MYFFETDGKDYTYKIYSVANRQKLHYSLHVLVKMADSLEFAFTFTFIHLADAFIQSDLQLRNTISDTL